MTRMYCFRFCHPECNMANKTSAVASSNTGSAPSFLLRSAAALRTPALYVEHELRHLSANTAKNGKTKQKKKEIGVWDANQPVALL